MDTISNVAAKIKNAYKAGHESAQFPYSKLSESVLQALSRAGFIGKVNLSEEGKRKFIEASLKYDNGVPSLAEAKRVSKPSRRLYRGAKEIRRIRHGYGALILTTSKGVMTDTEARKAKIGGEPMLVVW
jgi:small subunit ribosomal protein S8